MYVLQQVPFMLLFCLQFLGEKSIFDSPIYICGALIFCLVIVHSSLTCSVFAFLDPYLEFSPVNWVQERGIAHAYMIDCTVVPPPLMGQVGSCLICIIKISHDSIESFLV